MESGGGSSELREEMGGGGGGGVLRLGVCWGGGVELGRAGEGRM